MFVSTPASLHMHASLGQLRLIPGAWTPPLLLLQGLRWTKAPAEAHMFPRLRLAARPHLVSLAGGTTHLPLTDPSARCADAGRLARLFQRLSAAYSSLLALPQETPTSQAHSAERGGQT